MKQRGAIWTVIDKNCALLGYYATRSGNSLPGLTEQPIVPTFKGQNFDPWRWELKVVQKKSERNCYYSLRNNPEERRSYLLRGSSLKSRDECQILSETTFLPFLVFSSMKIIMKRVIICWGFFKAVEYLLLCFFVYLITFLTHTVDLLAHNKVEFKWP